MRLICGFYYLDGRNAETERLEEMIQAMIEPGLTPQVARFLDGPVALAVLDFGRTTSFEIVKGENGSIIAADCRLDEPAKLKHEFGLPRKSGDDEILSAFLAHHGERGLKEMLGDFAFACWDPESKILHCARDGMGVRPFFMTKDNEDVFAFASLPRALHAAGFASREIDEYFLAGEMLFAPSGPEHSLFADIARLAPGHMLRVFRGRIDLECYWRLGPEMAGKMKCSPEEASEALSSALTEAVRSRLPEIGPVAAHLSGGLDSSAITVLASRILRLQSRQLLAYSFLSKTEEAERPYVEMVLEQEKDIVWNSVTIDDREAFFWPKMDSDQLFPMDISNPDIRVCSDAASRGANMLLSGWGGDQGATFNGRGALAESLLRGYWTYLIHEVRAFRNASGCSVFGIMKGELRYLLPRAIWNELRHLLGKDPGLVDGASSLLRPEFAGKASGTGFIAGPDACMNRFRMLTGHRLTRRLEEWAMMGSRHGLSVGFPMLDRRVVELALSLPSQLFLREGWRRRVCRDAMKGILPEKIRLRHDKLRPFPEIDSFLDSEREKLMIRLAEYCTHPRFDSLFDREEIGKAIRTAGDTAAVVALKRIFNAAAFIRQHSP